MSHLIVKVTGFDPVGDHTLRVRFDEGTAQVINSLPVLADELFAPLRDKNPYPSPSRPRVPHARLAQRG